MSTMRQISGVHMNGKVVYHIYCLTCGHYKSLNVTRHKDARGSAEKLGYKRTVGGWICPTCQEAPPASPESEES